jgi:hypothetical protein
MSCLVQNVSHNASHIQYAFVKSNLEYIIARHEINNHSQVQSYFVYLYQLTQYKNLLERRVS